MYASLPRHMAMAPEHLSNLKETVLAELMYEGDNEGRLPPAQTWADALRLYVGSKHSFECEYLNNRKPNQYGHAFLRSLSTREGAKIEDPATQALQFDSTDLSWNANGPLLQLMPPSGRPDGTGTSEVAFLDGHMKRQSRDQAFSMAASRSVRKK